MIIIFFKIFFTTVSLFIYGFSLNRLIKINEKNFFLSILKGSVLSGFLALVIHFFLPLNLVVNTFVISIFIIYFITQYRNIFWIKFLKNIFLVSCLAFILIFVSDGFEPDASLYHLPATYNINQEKIILGLNNIHFRMGIISILQYINALQVNLINGPEGILFTSAISISALLVFFIFELFEKIKKKIDFTPFFITLLIAIICLRFNRYSDFGNDALGHTFFILLIFQLVNCKPLKQIYLNKNINLCIAFLCLQKVFFFYLAFIPLISVLIKIKSDRKIELNSSHLFSTIFLLLWILKNVLVSGCAIYPISNTCSERLIWYKVESSYAPNAQIVTLEGEAWSKNWNKNQTNMEMKSYVKNFNWLNTWKSDHFLVIKNKLSPFLILIIFMIILKIKFYGKNFLLFQKNEIKNFFKENYLFSLLICLLGFALWFLKFPIFRYGSSFILVGLSIITLPLIFNYKLKKKKFVFIISILVSIFLIKNLQRIYIDFNKKPFTHNITSNNFEEFKINNLNFYRHDYGCGYTKKLCTNYSSVLKNLNVIKKKNYIIIFTE